MRKGKWSELWKRYKYVALVVLAGILLMLLPTGAAAKERTGETKTGQEEFDLEKTEQRMVELLKSIHGVGKVRLMLTLQSGTRLQLAEDVQQSRRAGESSGSSQTVTLNRGSGSGQEIVVTERWYPTYQGAVVVCQGAESSGVRLAVTEAVQALTGLSADHIQVVQWTK